MARQVAHQRDSVIHKASAFSHQINAIVIFKRVLRELVFDGLTGGVIPIADHPGADQTLPPVLCVRQRQQGISAGFCAQHVGGQKLRGPHGHFIMASTGNGIEVQPVVSDA